ncbi:hypothetical protein BV25DRAFT_1805904 [Artomyces pyxidatus]|uniref:Uncharacterized protein n=1 Tax=Artomyces pyxidatus TaxID=48021 RepID=A0ACB8SZM0_9AGAM|nr:hypothetical protein BV25DRAFT_1805904 [Artomyces pyxidatus]
MSGTVSLAALFGSLQLRGPVSPLLTLICHVDIHQSILDDCSPATLLRISWTCKCAHTAIRDYMGRAFDINRHLSAWFPDPIAFRALQARTTMLISGSNALQYLNRWFYPGSDLDVYVPLRHIHEVAGWLNNIGYVFTPHNGQLEADDFAEAVGDMEESLAHRAVGIYRMRGVAGVFNFVKPAEGDNAGKKIQLIVVSRAAAEVILNFHSTCVMNVISYSHAYSLFPHATFESREALLCREDEAIPPEVLVKYTTRGWKLFPTRPERTMDPSFVPGSRWIDDRLSWVLPLPTVGVVPADFPPDPIAQTNWQLEYRFDTRDVTPDPLQYDFTERAVMRYSLIKSPFLKHIYTLTDELLVLAVSGAMEGVSSAWTKTKIRLGRPWLRNEDMPK